MKLEIATDNSDNDQQSDALGDWSNIDGVRGEQEWISESEEHHDRDVWHDGVFFGNGGMILSEDESTHVIHEVLGATLISKKAMLVTMRTPRMIQTVSIENVAVHSYV
jgi:hypothetical protein